MGNAQQKALRFTPHYPRHCERSEAIYVPHHPCHTPCHCERSEAIYTPINYPCDGNLVSMTDRYLSPIIREFCFKDHKMAFVSGPRQCGKTTLAKSLLQERGVGAYYNWDESQFRKLWTKNPSKAIAHDTSSVPLTVFDEIHKAKLWKRTLKGIYDTLTSPSDILVTGSAQLNVYKKGSDSLLGRYFHFRLHPFSLREMSSLDPLPPDTWIRFLFSRSLQGYKSQRSQYETLYRFGGFPEPLFSQNEKKARLWRLSRAEKVIREDLRDLSRIPELSQIEMLTSLLPEKVGAPFSVASVRGDMEVSHQTLTRWLAYLKELYYIFEIKPYSKTVFRSLKKEGKIYFWDFSQIDDPAARFENLVACHLLKTCHFWTDSGEGVYDLFYLRDKEKREIDFLITRDGEPWLPIEAKLSDTTPSSHWSKFLSQLPCKEAVQIIHDSTASWKVIAKENKKLLIAPASELLMYFA